MINAFALLRFRARNPEDLSAIEVIYLLLLLLLFSPIIVFVFFHQSREPSQFVKSSKNRRNLISIPTLTFNDFKAAFDSVSRDSLWKILQICGVPQELSVLVRQLYTDTRSAVRLASSLSEEFSIETGLKQGCGIAPDLFNFVIDHIMRRLLSRCNLGIQLGEYQLTDLDYADAIAICAPSACVLQEALTILQEEANLVGMHISWPKTKLMAITPKPTNHLPLKICNKEVVFVDYFTYLGSLITNDGASSRDITYRIAKTASAMCRLSNALFRKHRISIRTKINMYRALVVSVLLYGSEAWAITLADRRRLDVFDMRCQGRLLRVFWQKHVSNQSIRERTKQPIASSLLRQRRLRWFGHLHRMSSSLPVRRVFTSTLISMVGRDKEAAPKPDGLIQSSTTSTQLASTPSMPHRWSMTDPSGRPLLADCQRSNPSMALKSSKSSKSREPDSLMERI